MIKCEACEEFFETMNYKNKYCNECYDKMCKDAVEKMKLIETKNTYLKHINTICEIQLSLIERMRIIEKNTMFPEFYEGLSLNMEIIQELIKKIKSS